MGSTDYEIVSAHSTKLSVLGQLEEIILDVAVLAGDKLGMVK